MKILSSQSLSAGRKIHSRILTYGMLGWGFRLLERVLALVLLWAVLAGASVWLELTFHLRPWPSLLLRVIGLTALAGFGFCWLRAFFRKRPTVSGLSRDLERKVPGLFNRLVTATEFRHEAALPDGGILRYFSPRLVNAFFIETQHALRRRSLVRALARPGFAAAVVGVVGLVIAASFLPRFTAYEWQSVLNLYLAPFHRDPFYDPTTLLVEPGDAKVTIGDDLTVRAVVTGINPTSSDIVFASADFPPDRVRMHREEDGAFTHQFRNLQESLRYAVVAGSKRSPDYTIEVVKPIRLVHLGVLLSYPSYTGMGLEVGSEEEGSIEAPIGTRCRLTAQFDEVADEAALHLRQGEGEGFEKTEEMKDSGAGWEAEFTILSDGVYSITADWDGGSPGESPAYTVKAIRDASPTVRLVTPATNVDLSGKRPLPSFVSLGEGGPQMAVRYLAGDDLGLRETALVIEDSAGEVVEKLPMHAFTGKTTEAERTYPWALRDWWGGEDIWIHVEVKDSLAARPDLGREFYSEEEIGRHTVASRKVLLTWDENAQIAQADESRASRREGEEEEEDGGKGIDEMDAGTDGPGTKVPLETKSRKSGSGNEIQDLVAEVGEIRSLQEELNRDAADEGGGEKGRTDGAEQDETDVGGDEGLAAAERQRDLAERTREVETKVRELASTYRKEPGDGPGHRERAPGGGEGGDQDKTQTPTDLAEQLNRIASRLSRKVVWEGEPLEPGVGSQMEKNVTDLSNRRWDDATARGERIVRDLETVERMLAEAGRQAETETAKAGNRVKDSPGGGEEPSPGDGGKVTDATQSPGDTAEENEAGDGDGGGEKDEGESPPAPGGDPGINPVAGPVSAAARNFPDWKPLLPDGDFEKGKASESPVRPGKLKFGKGTAYSSEKIPEEYREEVNRFYELIEPP